MKIYISGPISAPIVGKTKEELKQEFYHAQDKLEAQGHEVVNPLEVMACVDFSCGGEHPVHTWACYMRYDLIDMLSCDAIAMLEDWESSPGARLELHVASSVGMEVLFL